MKILDFPILRQTYDYDCGAKATEAVLGYYGLDIREEKIIKIAKTTKEGTPINGIKKVAKKYNLKCKAKEMNIEEIKDCINKNIPVILLLQAWTEKKKPNWKEDWVDGHYVVVIGYDKKKMYFEDPSSILRTYLNLKELKDRWHDEDCDGCKFNHYGIVIYGHKKEFNSKKIIHMN